MKKTLLGLSIAAALVSLPSFAEVRINGFASIVGGQTLDDDDTLYGYDNDFNMEQESKFALQVSADLQERLSATAQVIARGENDFDAEFEWAYLTYEISDNSQLSAGKMRIPFYRYSDFLDVGYAYRWVRPPQSVYNLSFTTYEGLSYLHNSTLGDWDSALQLMYGAVNDDIVAVTNNDAAELNDTLGVNWTLSRDWFTARVAYFMSEASIDVSNSAQLTSLLNGLDGYGLSEQRQDLEIEEDDAYFAAIGFGVDYNNFLFDAEYTQFEVEDSILAKQRQYYASVGYRIDDWTVHFTYENNDDENDSSELNTIPAQIQTPNGPINVSTNPSDPNAPLLRDATNFVLLSQRAESNTYTIGARYNFHPSAAFKIDVSRFEDDITNTEVDLVSMGVDLVF
ncbi:porin [Pseudoalteromonas sp. MM17-2]|uniref:porin n=1 Tax=Pseudoalteromonas sp. MM17-2 TaxID=2917753 RepID=UPI001EF50010|nr:porin [Pseudoalteromonas sp. MM17-2]MCG7543067.1 porin [Pseudoalteromonas sp. MM17-2]